MVLRLLQLNIFQGKNLDKIIDFVTKNKVDILHFQEVTTGKMSKGGKAKYPDENTDRIFSPNEKFIGINCIGEIKKSLGFEVENVVATSYTNDPASSIGNATFFNGNVKLVKSETIWLKDFFSIPEDFSDIAVLPRAALICKFEGNSKEFYTVNAHLAWGKNSSDEPYKIEQAEKLYDRLKEVKTPFILSGDFNVTPETQTASMFDDLARNLDKENGITNTLNPDVHATKTLFPKGLAVDYVFASKDINVKSFELITEDLSDHYGLLLEFEI